MFNPSVIFLAFANAKNDLASLKKESAAIADLLAPVEDNEKSILVKREESAENSDIDKYLGRYKDRLAIFHYAGHADGKLLAFEDDEGNADGLANLLGIQKHLKLVFLNACSTEEQAYLYIKAGVKAIIATTVPVRDEHAMEFAKTFYGMLAQNATIEEAYLAAIGKLKLIHERYTQHENNIVFYENVEIAQSRNKEKQVADTQNTRSTEEKEEQTVIETKVEKNNVQYITRKLVRRNYKPKQEFIPWRLYINANHKDILKWKITEPPIKEYLQLGTATYFQKIFNARFQYIDFTKQVYAKDENNETQPINLAQEIQELWENNGQHVFVTGKGGTGKTTNIIRVWKHFVEQSKSWSQPIPLYISLSDYNQGEYERNFIVYQIGENYLGKEKLPDEAFNQLFQILHHSKVLKDGKRLPSFILFLDGMDEIVVEHQQLLDEIAELSKEAKGIQIVITHIEKLTKRWASPFHHIELMPLQNDLSNLAFGSSHFTSTSLDMLLSNPMMNQIYQDGAAVMSRHLNNKVLNFKLPVTTRGEMLWNYFEVEIAKKYELFIDTEREPFFYFQFKFLSKHFLPYLAYLMEKANMSSFSEDQLQSAINEICNNIYQRHFLKTYKEFRRDFAYFKLDAPDWVKEEERFEIYKELLTIHFPTIFVQEGKRFQFTHQLYRDFLAAVHIQNNIVLSLRQNILPTTLVERQLPTNNNLYLFLGELEGEQYNFGDAVTVSDNKTLLQQTLEQCRKVFDKRVLGHTIWNILHIWSDLRGQLSGLDLSNLDLRGFSLNGVKLQAQTHYHNGAVSFHNALIDRNVFLGGSERGRVLDVKFSKSLSYSQDYSGYGTEKTLLFASASHDGTVKVFEMNSKKCFDVFDDAKGEITAIEFTPCGKFIVGVATDGYLRVWNLNENGLIFAVKAHDKPVTSIAISKDGQLIATCSEDTLIKIWHRECDNHWVEVQVLEGHTKTVECLKFTADNHYLVSGAWDRSIRLWDLQLKEMYWEKHDHVSYVNAVAVSPDGKSVLSASSDDTILEWTLQDGKVQQKYFDHSSGVNDVAYSPDGKHIVSASSDETIKIWDRATGDCLRTLKGHHYRVNAVMYSPDGEYLISGSSDGTVKIWELDTFTATHTFQNYNGLHVQGIDFRHLHQDSHLPSFDKSLLRQYGAIFNNEDELIWGDLMDRLCYLFEE